MSPGVTPLSHEVYQLHMLVFWICVGIGVIVFGMMFYILVNHRKSKGALAASFHENTFIEVTWAIIPLIILVLIAVPATKALLRMNDTSDAALTIKVTGYQWRWRYEYLDQGLDFFSTLSTPANQLNNLADKETWYLLEVDHPLIVPIHKKIRFLFTSNDVIHSWWVPTLGLKRDTIPGFINESWAIIEKTGEYRGQCAELCGVNHGFMPIVVKAVQPAEFNQWVSKAKQDFSPSLTSHT
jgi:cytochrome c oxidase subunit 2